MVMSEHKTCPVCGGLDPEPRWFCLRRFIGEAKQGEPCTYALKDAGEQLADLKERIGELRK